MKKFIKVILMLIVVITITACNSREDVEHLSQKDLIKYVEKNITEEIQFIESNTQDVDNYIYTFKLVDRNINFQIRDYIHNSGLNIDATQFYDNYERSIIFNDYVLSILNNLEQRRLSIKNKYNFEEIYYDNIGSHIITIKDYTDLSNLSKYIVELDNLYQFNIKDIEEIELWNVDLADVISFSKTQSAIEGISYSTSEKTRLKCDKVYKQLEEQYVKQLKQFNLTDETIPNDIWNKY